MKMPTIRQSASFTSQAKVKEIRIDTAMVTERPGIAPM
jgi:hypothetical protein